MKKNTTKRSLLASLLALVMCVTMLVGTTFAWFTDSASVSVSKIEAGKLDIDVFYADTADGSEGSNWTLLTKNSDPLSFLRKQADGTLAQDASILWEPNCTYSLPALKIVNNGNLALKYKVLITGIQGNSELNDVIDWTMKLGDADFVMGSEHSLAAKTGDTVTSDILTIQGHMDADAGNKYQGMTIEGVSITVLATQDTVESDSKDNQYDKDAVYPVASAAELTTALENAKDGDVVVLADAIEIPAEDYNAYKRLTIAADNVTIDLNGKELTASNHTVTITGDNVTLKNGKIVATTTSASQTYGSYGIAVSGKNVVIDGVTLVGGISVTGYDAMDDSVVYDGVSATITNCNITATNYYAVCAQGQASAIVKNSTLIAENGYAFFWIEKGYTDAYGTVADSSLTYETATVTMTGSKPLYNTSGLAPVAQ